MGPGPQASHQKGPPTRNRKISFTFKALKRSQGKDIHVDRRMTKKAEVKEKNIDNLFFAHRFQWVPGLPLPKSGAVTNV
jgi:hypothetical protein